MQVSTKIKAGKLYRFLQCAIRMRRMQKSRSADFSASIQQVERDFDAQLDILLDDLDGAQTNKIIVAMRGG